jgi:hypothetical protein
MDPVFAIPLRSTMLGGLGPLLPPPPAPPLSSFNNNADCLNLDASQASLSFARLRMWRTMKAAKMATPITPATTPTTMPTIWPVLLAPTGSLADRSVADAEGAGLLVRLTTLVTVGVKESDEPAATGRLVYLFISKGLANARIENARRQKRMKRG